MNRDLLRRIETLERDATTRAVLWIGPPEAGLAGWEILPGTDSIKVWRQEGETGDELETRVITEE